MCCPCERDIGRRRRTKHPTERARIQFNCGRVAHAVNLRWDIWPLLGWCPDCGKDEPYKFLRTNFQARYGR